MSMETTSVTALATIATQRVDAQRRELIQLTLLKRALALSGQSALQLVEAAAQSSPNPPHLGTVIDTWA